MNKRPLILGVAVLLICVGLSGCFQETPVSEGKVKFAIEDVTVTSELEFFDHWTNETEIIVTNTTKIVIVSITIENKEDKFLKVMESFTDGLTDDKGNRYYNKLFLELNDSTYAVEKITSIDEDELFDIGLSIEISPTSVELKKIVYQIPINREPDRLRLSYGFKANEFAKVEKWYDISLELS